MMRLCIRAIVAVANKAAYVKTTPAAEKESSSFGDSYTSTFYGLTYPEK